MSLPELVLLAVGLSMDAFAVAACAGLTMPKATLKKALIVGLYFGVFQAVMPLIGFALAIWFAEHISSLDHWIAFVLLGVIGGKMILDSCQINEGDYVEHSNETSPGENGRQEISLRPTTMLPLAVATSIDALAVGVSFAFLNARIDIAVVFIGVTTLVLSMLGVKLGHTLGAKLKSKATLAGGVILILIGTKILLEHLGFIG